MKKYSYRKNSYIIPSWISDVKLNSDILDKYGFFCTSGYHDDNNIVHYEIKDNTTEIIFTIEGDEPNIFNKKLDDLCIYHFKILRIKKINKIQSKNEKCSK